MTPKFLREEAARFRGMAEEQTREASKLRLLGMAADYEARATVADGIVVPAPVDESEPTVAEVSEPEPAPPAKIVLTPKEGVPVARRSVGRPRLRITP